MFIAITLHSFLPVHHSVAKYVTLELIMSHAHENYNTYKYIFILKVNSLTSMHS